MEHVQIVRDIANTNWTKMREIYESVGWVKHTEPIIQRVFQASHIVALAFCSGRLVGFGRALSDGVFNAAIYDVVVHRDYQGKGIGKAIMKDLLEQLDAISCIHLISTIGNEPFYIQSGFRKAKTAFARYRSMDLAQIYLEGGDGSEHSAGKGG
ncbi:GNAT family N-acetyltransferase [Anoxybacillus rupiensis]|uniref:GNAT family N-acetyltransferase n=1 Tax=Anoxybacteroides rupiense TaxID=311460 RepID=A0ABD5IVT8_9BACL|nr:GNAT family N-acetyltransferase [Anoxybacillus rupiensis]